MIPISQKRSSNMNPKIEFRYVVEFEPYVPDPKYYDVEKPLEELTNGELMEMAKMDTEDAIDKIEFFNPKNIYVEVIIDGTVFRRVKYDE
jgi:hypothetical protein